MKVTKRIAIAMRCLGGKLEFAAADPDPKTLQELATEYNCKNCPETKTCDKLYIAAKEIGVKRNELNSG